MDLRGNGIILPREAKAFAKKSGSDGITSNGSL